MAGYFGEEYTPSLTPQNNIIISNQTDLGDEYMNCPDTDRIEPAGAVVVYNKYNPNKAVNTVANEQFFSIVNEYMDTYDYDTNQRLMVLDEEEQNTLILSLTNKIYQMIIDKVDEIDFGEIPKTKGDITRLSRYHEMLECIDLISKLFESYKEDPTPVRTIENAIKYIEDDKEVYAACFAGNISLGINIYNTMTLACVSSLSYMIAVCIEYIKDPNKPGLKVTMDKTGVSKVKEHLLYENLVKFNDSCRKSEIEKALRPLISNKAKGFVGIGSLLVAASIAVGTIALIMTSLTMIRDCVYFFYATRARVSKYFDIQADLLEMNANELEDNASIETVGDKNKVIKRQLAIAAAFRKIADTIAIEANKSEREATKEIKADTRRYKIDEVETDPTANNPSMGGGALF